MTDQQPVVGNADEPDIFTALYTPQFYNEYMDFEKYPPSLVKEEFSKKNWITSELKDEIKLCAPRKDDIDPKKDNLRNKIALENAANRLFQKGRIFASHIQLVQVVKKFADLWAFRITSSGQQIQCHFGKPTYKCRSKGERSYEESMKITIKCPFVINYSILGRRKNIRIRETGSMTENNNTIKLPKVYYQVRISKVNGKHECRLDTPSHRIAIQNSGTFTIEPEKFSSVIKDLQEDINMKRQVLRNKLKYIVPQYLLNRDKFLDNFRSRVINKFMVDLDSTFDNIEDCNSLLDPKSSAADEVIMNDTNLYSDNLKNLLKKTIQGNDGDIWDVLIYMKAIQSKSPGFCYRVQYDKHSGRPLGVCWMFVEMRENLLRFADLIFLDACKRRHNKPGWPYHAVVVLDNEKQVIPVCECLGCAESNENYAFLLESCKLFETRWNQKDIKIIFADQLISNQLLIFLGITDSCLLHGDHYHLLNKVFPDLFKPDWEVIRHHITEMIDAKDKETWDKLYTDACSKIEHNPSLYTKLEKVHQNAQYYSKWYLLTIEGNLDRNGSVPSEINHASIRRHLGKNNSFSLPENIERLFTRYEYQIGLRLNSEMVKKSKRQDYKAKEYSGPRRDDHIRARQTFSDFSFKKYAQNVDKHLQSITDEHGIIHVWRSTVDWNDRKECKEYVTYPAGDRCSCNERISFQWQCPHELCADGFLILGKWNHRWYNQSAYRETFPDHKLPNIMENYVDTEIEGQYNVQQIDEEDPIGNDNDTSISVMEQDKDSVNFDNEDSSECHKLSYVELHNLCERYLRLINKNKVHMSNFQSTMKELIRRAELGLHTNVTFGTTITTAERNKNSPVKASLHQDRRESRLLSRYEQFSLSNHQPKKKRQTLSSLKGNDSRHVDYNPSGKSCGFCGGQGHQIQNCSKKIGYGPELLKNEEFKLQFTKQLKLPDHFLITNRVETRKTIRASVPSTSKGIIIHEKISEDTVIISLIDKGTGDLNVKYRHYPFDIEKVSTYINGGIKSRVIISNLQVNSNRTPRELEVQRLLGAYGVASSQNSDVPLSQLSHGSRQYQLFSQRLPLSQGGFPHPSQDNSVQNALLNLSGNPSLPYVQEHQPLDLSQPSYLQDQGIFHPSQSGSGNI